MERMTALCWAIAAADASLFAPGNNKKAVATVKKTMIELARRNMQSFLDGKGREKPKTSANVFYKIRP